MATAVAARVVFSEVRSDAAAATTTTTTSGLTVTAGLAALGQSGSGRQRVTLGLLGLLGLLGASLISLSAFVVLEARTAAPLLPLRVVLDRNRGGALLVQICIGAALLAILCFSRGDSSER